MAEFLRHITAADRAELLAKARRARFEPDQPILAEGSREHAIFLLESGSARVERGHMDFYVEIARLGAGDVFGEMSFVEGDATSASVVADEPCEVAVVDGDQVEAMMAADPGFYGRFYHSIAAILSHRLRETTADGIAEFAWGGNAIEGAEDIDPATVGRRSTDDLWGGGSPVRDFAAEQDPE